mmetsp:Transcript_65454/g.188587  ORF Transcript_65454/g.188587 Transcript_65454/m.188587 type:complete len:238 (+) Transcript_65454:740-1453(+)
MLRRLRPQDWISSGLTGRSMSADGPRRKTLPFAVDFLTSRRAYCIISTITPLLSASRSRILASSMTFCSTNRFVNVAIFLKTRSNISASSSSTSSPSSASLSRSVSSALLVRLMAWFNTFDMVCAVLSIFSRGATTMRSILKLMSNTDRPTQRLMKKTTPASMAASYLPAAVQSKYTDALSPPSQPGRSTRHLETRCRKMFCFRLGSRPLSLSVPAMGTLSPCNETCSSKPSSLYGK